MTTTSPRYPLADWLAWLQSQGQLPCSGCRWEWQSFGKIHGIPLGDGWVRITTDPRCQEHS